MALEWKKIVTAPVAIADGGSGQVTAQAAIDALTAVGAATNEHVLTKDTATGNAIFKAVAGGGSAAFSAYSGEDSDLQTLALSHAYLAQTDGFVVAYARLGESETLTGYVGATNNPPVDGILVQYVKAGLSTIYNAISFPVAAGEYFEITSAGGDQEKIYWKSVGTLAKPIDQEA